MWKGEHLRTENYETYCVREKLDKEYVKESNRVEQEDYVDCCFESKAG